MVLSFRRRQLRERAAAGAHAAEVRLDGRLVPRQAEHQGAARDPRPGSHAGEPFYYSPLDTSLLRIVFTITAVEAFIGAVYYARREIFIYFNYDPLFIRVMTESNFRAVPVVPEPRSSSRDSQLRRVFRLGLYT